MVKSLAEYSIVRVCNLIQSSSAYDGWSMNQRCPQIGDTGIFIDLLHAKGFPDKYVVESCDADGITIWLSDFFREEIESVDDESI